MLSMVAHARKSDPEDTFDSPCHLNENGRESNELARPPSPLLKCQMCASGLWP